MIRVYSHRLVLALAEALLLGKHSPSALFMPTTYSQGRFCSNVCIYNTLPAKATWENESGKIFVVLTQNSLVLATLI